MVRGLNTLHEVKPYIGYLGGPLQNPIAKESALKIQSYEWRRFFNRASRLGEELSCPPPSAVWVARARQSVSGHPQPFSMEKGGGSEKRGLIDIA
ncbi:hypothetical protein CEXT_776111 [Caerostris extrusa]|uniref:Uncharacterized protein n=1 Tax=Caerostris extrusa TaxID=172846 RepID=A0AAV4QKQ9_CAEEX|nr:hypothetical protein CEXT_776111 [Caerostris extrusa]